MRTIEKKQRTPRRARAAAYACALAFVAATPAASYRAIITGAANADDVPVVTSIVNRRVPVPSLMVHVVVEPSVALTTAVHWSSPDGKNGFSGPLADGDGGGAGPDSDTTLADDVGVVPRHDARGNALIVADVGPPVNARATFVVRDEVAIGFGCYGFIASGPSVSLAGGVPRSAVLAAADVAVVGPGNRLGTLPGYGCWGENLDEKATAYHLIFNTGGSVHRDSAPDEFVKELPYDAVDPTHPLDVRSSDGFTYRLHLTPSARTYFVGWVEKIDER